MKRIMALILAALLLAGCSERQLDTGKKKSEDKEEKVSSAPVESSKPEKKEEKPEPVIFTQPDPSPDDPSLEDLRRVMGQMINNGKMDAVQKIMKTLGVERLSDLEAEKYPALTELLKEEGAQI